MSWVSSLRGSWVIAVSAGSVAGFHVPAAFAAGMPLAFAFRYLTKLPSSFRTSRCLDCAGCVSLMSHVHSTFTSRESCTDLGRVARDRGGDGADVCRSGREGCLQLSQRSGAGGGFVQSLRGRAVPCGRKRSEYAGVSWGAGGGGREAVREAGHSCG